MAKRPIPRICGALLWTMLAQSASAADNGQALADWLLESAGRPAGLVVHVGCGEAQLTESLGRSGKLLVHGLAIDAGDVAAARRRLGARPGYGQVSVDHWDGGQLPYADDLVNLVVCEAPASPVLVQELLRVLCPNGVALFRGSGIRDAEILRGHGGWSKLVKPRPAEMDEWTHPYHDAGGSSHSNDRMLETPTGVRWLAAPLFPLAERKTSTQAQIVAGGRIFHITQNVMENVGWYRKEEPPSFLVARDAFNGLALWQRDWKGPVMATGQLNPNLVADGERLVIAEGTAAVAIDARSGETLRQYACGGVPEEILVSGGRVLVRTAAGLRVFDAASGAARWQRDIAKISNVTIDGELVLFVGGEGPVREVVGLKLDDGAPAGSLTVQGLSLFARIFFSTGGVVGIVDKGQVKVLSVRDGKLLWSRDTKAVPQKQYVDERYVGHFFGGGLLWFRNAVLDERRFSKQEIWQGVDPATGAVRRELKPQTSWPSGRSPGKHGCQPIVSSGRLVIFSRQGALLDLDQGALHDFSFSRGGCGIGATPANGLLYVPPHACACRANVIRGVAALSSSPPPKEETGRDPGRLVKGPAFAGAASAAKAAAKPAAASDWPSYRRDHERSASTTVSLPPTLRPLWERPLVAQEQGASAAEWSLRIGSRITAPVVADGRVVLGIPNAHAVVALDLESGKELWRFVAGGRVNAPPTLWGGLCLFGAHDGRVYCLSAESGELVWQFRAAPREQRIVAFGQLESSWPVHGGVLLRDGVAYAAAGRAPQADGGIFVHALRPESGQLLWSTKLEQGISVNDVLVSHGGSLIVAGTPLDLRTGAPAKGGEDHKRPGNGLHLYGGMAGMLEAGWTRIPNGSQKDIQDWKHDNSAGHIFAIAGESWAASVKDAITFAGTKPWKMEVAKPQQPEAMVLTPDALWVAGVPSRSRRENGFLWGIGIADGKRFAEMPLPVGPVWDGMAIAAGKLLLSCEDGTLRCYGP